VSPDEDHRYRPPGQYPRSHIAAECGGACACATCHVYVTDGWYEKLPPPSDAEVDMLDMALAVEPGSSRLSCQVICSDATDGIKVTVAPE
jgi:2Fe-2S ferredoxin